MSILSNRLLTKYKKIDYILLFSCLTLVIIGLVFVFSASYYTAEEDFGNKFYYLNKQVIGAITGLICMNAVILIDINILKKLYLPLIVVSILLLVLVFIPFFSIESYGAKRWIGIGHFSFQPSEIAKFAFVLFCAVYLSNSNVNITKLHHTIPVIVVGIIICALIIMEPNMSVTVCVAMLMVCMLFIGGVPIKHLLLCLIPAVIAVPILILIEPYRLARLMAFIDPWATPKEEGYQLIQSLYALGNGGWFGVGLFNSRQKYEFLPFAESDFILSIIGEETGIVGCFILFCIYVTLILKGVKLATKAPNRYLSLLSGGITFVIAIQTLINLAVVSGCIPPTGIPLPFISYGGTSLVMFMSAVGILLNVSSLCASEQNIAKPHIINKRVRK